MQVKFTYIITIFEKELLTKLKYRDKNTNCSYKTYDIVRNLIDLNY